MPIQDERKISLKVPIIPELDPRATKKVIKDTTDLIKRLSAAKVDFKELGRLSNANIKQINDMSKAAGVFASRLTKGAKESFSKIQELGQELEEAFKGADALNKLAKTARTKAAKSDIEKRQIIQSRLISGLNKQISVAQSQFSKYGNEMTKVQRSQQRYHKNIEQMSKFSGKDMRDGLKAGLRQMFSGGKGAGLSGAGGIVTSLGRGAAGAVSRKNLSGAAAGGQGGANSMLAMRSISMAAGSLAGIAVVMGTLIKLIQMASEHQAKLNKTMIDGMGTANDFTKSTESYGSAISDVRNAAIDSTRALLGFGVNSEMALKTINSFAKEATGSIVQTRNELVKMGGGDIQKGMTLFSKSAIAYGKALGMEMTEVGSMMGNFVGELGYSTTTVTSLMSDIVSTAATSGMPVYKFMDIFRQTIPHVELFSNRMEELAGTIKLLSKSMSPEQVKEFMGAWSQGLKYDSFSSRLKKTLVGGVGQTNALLQKGFAERASVMASQLGDDLGGEFQAAFKSGDMKKAYGVIASAKSRGVGNPALFGQMTQLMQSEQARRTGGALGTATAAKGASMMEQVRMAKLQQKTITGTNVGISGIDEHVMEQLGYSPQQIASLNAFDATMQENKTTLKTYGATTSKSINDALVKIIARSKGIDESQVTREDMSKATEDQISAASELSVKQEKTELTALDLAAKQYTETTSVSDILQNVIAYWLEKIFQFMQPIVDGINKMFGWMSGSDKQREASKSITAWQANIDSMGGSKDFKAQMGLASKALQSDVSAGKTGRELGQSIGKTMDYVDPKRIASSTDIQDYLRGRAKATGATGMEVHELSNAVTDAMAAGDMGKAFGALADFGGDDQGEMLEFAKLLATKYGVSDAAAGADPGRRSGTSAVAQVGGVSDLNKAEGREVTDTQNVEALGVLTGANRGDAAGSTPLTDSIESGVANEGVEAHLADQTKQAEDQNKNLAKLDKKMATGVRVDASDKTQKVINTATLDAFRIALTEFAIHNARMQASPEYAQSFLDADKGIVGTGKTLGALATTEGTTSDDVFSTLGTKHDGGPVSANGAYRLLKGEHVLSQRAMSNIASGASSVSPVHAEVHLHGTNIGPMQAQRLVESALGNVLRRH
jgi:hypothetical protein